MSMITLNLIKDYITGSYNSTHFGVKYTKEVYDQMKKLQEEANNAETIAEIEDVLKRFEPLTLEDFKTTVEGTSKYLQVNERTNEVFLKYNGEISNVAMPKGFVDRLYESIEKDIDIQPMIKFWVRVLRNPKLNKVKLDRIVNYINTTYIDKELAYKLMDKHGISSKEATKAATGRQVPITNEGLLQTYKVSTEITTKFDEKTGEKIDRYTATFDEETGLKTYKKPEYAEDLVFEPAVQGKSGDAFYCGEELGHKIKVGQRHYLDSWDKVNCDDNISCVKGLHVGNLDYIKGYQHDNTVTHNVFIDPMHIGAVPNDTSGAIRCKSYMVYDTFVGPTKSLYRSSDYAKLTDKEWKEMLKEAVKDIDTFTEETIKAAEESKKQSKMLSM